MTKMKWMLFSAALFALTSLCPAANQITVKATNNLQLARRTQTIELSAKDLASLGETDLHNIHVKDSAGKEVLCQAVDTDYDDYHKADIVIFQADFAPGETRTFIATKGARQEYKKEDFKAYGRFVRERFDDFAWENDRIAHRTYGKALIAWKGEPLTSSSIDIWSKRTPRMVIDEWYMVDNYHSDMGDGCDDYTAGATRGCGGNGIWADGKLFVPINFVSSRVLAAGPIRVLFELDYEPFDVNGKKVAETLRISLDAGSQLDHFQAILNPESGTGSLTAAVGLKKVTGETKQFSIESGSLTIWEPMEKRLGMQGVTAIVDPKALVKEAEDAQNNLLLVKAAPDRSVSYWAGFAWDRAGHVTTAEAWRRYVEEFAHGLSSPINISITAE